MEFARALMDPGHFEMGVRKRILDACCGSRRFEANDVFEYKILWTNTGSLVDQMEECEGSRVVEIFLETFASEGSAGGAQPPKVSLEAIEQLGFDRCEFARFEGT